MLAQALKERAIQSGQARTKLNSYVAEARKGIIDRCTESADLGRHSAVCKVRFTGPQAYLDIVRQYVIKELRHEGFHIIAADSTQLRISW